MCAANRDYMETGGMAEIADALAQYGTVEGMRAAAPLPRNAEDVLDSAVVRAGRQRLGLVDDLLNAGLTVPMPDWLSIMSFTFRRTADAGYAKRSMIPSAMGERHVSPGDYATIPIFCTWDDFSFNVRELLMSRRVGTPLDVSEVEQCVWNVNTAIEDQAINGAGIAVHGHSAPGALTSPPNTSAYAGNEAWDAAGHTGEEIIGDVMAMMDVAVADNYYGPFNLYIPRGYQSKLDTDYKSTSDITIRQRLLELPGLNAIRTIDYLPANRTLLVQMTSNVVDVIVGQAPTQVSWSDGPGWNRFWCVMSCMIVRWKSDYNSGVGYVVGNTT